MGLGPTRARDLRANIATYGFERGVTITLELLLDELMSLRESMVEIASVQNQLIDETQKVVNVSSSMRNILERMTRKEEQHDQVRGVGIIPDGNT